ncbi:50S ribosomal protein L15 [Candidatus Aerophobetes bacterium]|uniref:Large ribosomal subunit protein uL15 n=2 Tax=root TaxID=1 RepID=A0A523YRT5_UNCAE|nr:MAG: 50S ribosomal protein L15 [Candidatus Aerophobetes bacterium]
MDLSILRPSSGSTHSRKRVGRGPGSGHGKTSTRGHKGQKARSKIHKWFEGGQMPLVRRVPKRGFKSRFKQKDLIINIDDLNIFNREKIITPEILRASGLVKGRGKIKVLGRGRLSRPLRVKAHHFSKQAQEKIEEAKGEIEII